MPGLTNDIDFSSLSDDELQRLLDEEREKRKNFSPLRPKISSSSSSEKKKSPKTPKPKADVVEIDLD